MSVTLKEDIFQILETDHSYYLNNYYNREKYSPDIDADVSTLLEELPCEYLLDDINHICDSYIKKQHNYVEEDVKRQKAASIIHNFLLGVRNKLLFKQVKESLRSLSKKNPIKILKSASYPHAEIFEKTASRLVFRLAGEQFPPQIVFKLFIRQHLTNIRLYEDIINNCKQVTAGWFLFNVYKCNVCKTKVKYKNCVKKKNKRKENYISWIEEMYH